MLDEEPALHPDVRTMVSGDGGAHEVRRSSGMRDTGCSCFFIFPQTIAAEILRISPVITFAYGDLLKDGTTTDASETRRLSGS